MWKRAGKVAKEKGKLGRETEAGQEDNKKRAQMLPSLTVCVCLSLFMQQVDN